MALREISRQLSKFTKRPLSFNHICKRESLLGYECLIEAENVSCSNYYNYYPSNAYSLEKFVPQLSRNYCIKSSLLIRKPPDSYVRFLHVKNTRIETVELDTDKDVVRFSFGSETAKIQSQMEENRKWKRAKVSKKAKVNELRMFRLKAKKKQKSPNPEVRIRYRLDMAKRKEEWLIEKLKKYEVPQAPPEPYDPEVLTEEEMFYLKRTGEKRKNYVPVGRRGVFGGVILNMHLHWKKHETVKVVCKPCKPGQVHKYAEEIARLSRGVIIDIKPNNVIIMYRGKNYIQPDVMSPTDTLSKAKALEKYQFEQSLEHTSEFIEKLEKELEEYHKHIARYKSGKENGSHSSDDSDH